MDPQLMSYFDFQERDLGLIHQTIAWKNYATVNDFREDAKDIKALSLKLMLAKVIEVGAEKI